jgi:heat-inducible transcriptional repressor
MPETRVSPRERLVLTAIIELYIATGEPVASQAVAQHFAHKEGLSSATIRNVMVSLGDGGLLEQPHTSAGRVPTAAAFRYYVEQITRPDAPMGRIGVGGAAFTTIAQSGAPLSEERRGQIEESFSGVTSSNEYLERTSHVLALISSGLGVALASGTGDQVLEHIHFSRLSAGRVLAVVVTHAGAVLDRVLVLDREMTHLELETAARYLNESFRGWPIDRIRTEIGRRMDEERAAYDQMLASVEELCRKGALAVGAVAASVLYVEGMANLIGAEVDRDRLKQMLLALEAKQRLVDLLTAYVNGSQQEVRVVVGLDEASPAMQDLVLIGSPARLGGTSLGTVAVIAPTRIQYQEMIQAVRYVARLSERILEIPIQ